MEGHPAPGAHFDEDETYDPERARARVNAVIGRMGDGLGV
jgi:hypothetical protein